MSPTPQTWRCLPFDALHARTLYALLQLRTEVFVMEQHCVFQDMDGLQGLETHRQAGTEGDITDQTAGVTVQSTGQIDGHEPGRKPLTGPGQTGGLPRKGLGQARTKQSVDKEVSLRVGGVDLEGPAGPQGGGGNGIR